MGLARAPEVTFKFQRRRMTLLFEVSIDGRRAAREVHVGELLDCLGMRGCDLLEVWRIWRIGQGKRWDGPSQARSEVQMSTPLQVNGMAVHKALGAWRDRSRLTDPLTAMTRSLNAYRAIDSSLFQTVEVDGARIALRVFERYRDSGCADHISIGFAVAAYVEWQEQDAAAEREHTDDRTSMAIALRTDSTLSAQMESIRAIREQRPRAALD